MALPNSHKIVIGTSIVVADTTDHAPTAAYNLGTRTDQIDCTDLIAGTARQSAKLDFTANRDLEYTLGAAIEWETTPEVVAGETVDFYIGWSNSATATDANPGALTGSDAAYAGNAAGTLADSLKQLDYIGSMSMDNVINTDTIGVQIDTLIGTFSAKMRYGMLVVVNSSALAAFHSDMAETSFLISPNVFQTQD